LRDRAGPAGAVHRAPLGSHAERDCVRRAR
jgi:hypothetical protein